jgi:hypothetical protein
MPKNKDLKRLPVPHEEDGRILYVGPGRARKEEQEGGARRDERQCGEREDGSRVEEWVRLLDARGARSMVHEILRKYLYEEQGVPGGGHKR